MSTPVILLDLDGTLIDSQPGILASCRAALSALGHDLDSAADLSAIIGPPIEVGMTMLLKPFGDDRIGEAVAAYRAHYGETGLYQGPPYPSVAAMLTALQDGGARLFVATSKRSRFARRILEHFGLDRIFEAICGSEEGGALDEKPALIADILARFGLAPEHCVMAGDRRYDIAGAHANGMRALGVLWGYGSREELAAAGADGFVREPAALPAQALAMAAGR